MITNSASAAETTRKMSFKMLTVAVSMLIATSATISVFATAEKRAVSSKGGNQSVSITSPLKEATDTTKANKSGSSVTNPASHYIKKAFTVTINCDRKSYKKSTTGTTVQEILDSLNIKLGENDTVSPSSETELTEKTTITVNRVKYKERTAKEVIPFKTKTVVDKNLKVNESKVTKAGKNGSKVVTYSDKYVNGKHVSSEVIETKVIKKATDAVKTVGQVHVDALKAYRNNGAAITELKAPKDLKLNSDGSPVKYEYCIKGKATAYTGDPETSTGRKPMPGHIAVDPKMIPYGTELYITSADGTYVYGYSIAADTGGFVQMKNTTIDLYMNTEEMCRDWGNRAVNIYVLSK